ncbi:MAG: hypothetical protein E4G90_10585 [Gemmatimonadales bacterium]|nr:MAG: hypothetical protein E4G90_10585 [Gemmatimonadales bacterium]
MEGTNTMDLLPNRLDGRDSPFWADVQAGEARKEIEAGRLGDAVVSLTRAQYCLGVASQYDYDPADLAPLHASCDELQALLAAAVAKAIGQTVERH